MSPDPVAAPSTVVEPAPATADDLPLAHGAAVLSARIRCQPEDFRVDEVLGFAPDGAGEHVFLRVEKRGANTAWVAAQLARWAGIREVGVGYAGLKDRHAVAVQTFSLHLPGRDAPEAAPDSPEFRVLSRARHGRKLPRGALAGNRFELRLREVQGDHSAIEARLRVIAEHGVPNYFGEQRFGRDGDNVAQARAMLAGRRVRREQQSILLSAVRSAGFNRVLAARVAAGCWDCPVAGEVFMLEGSHSVFGPLPVDEELRQRCARGDIHPTAALWGRGTPRSEQVARDYDELTRMLGDDLIAGLEAAGMRQERRALRLPVAELVWDWPEPGCLRLAFRLPAGAYATSVLHELGITQDARSGASALVSA